jgi:hypothetical protein
MIQVEPVPFDEPLPPFIEEELPFNRDSEQLQREAGVDPAQCLRVGIVPGNNRTPLSWLFQGLQSRIWVTPEEGYWRVNHDEPLHWPGVRKLHPQSVQTVVWAAAVGSQLLAAQEIKAAEDMGRAIDLFVDKGSSDYNYQKLISLCGVNVAHVPDYGVQEMHNLRMDWRK